MRVFAIDKVHLVARDTSISVASILAENSVESWLFYCIGHLQLSCNFVKLCKK